MKNRVINTLAGIGIVISSFAIAGDLVSKTQLYVGTQDGCNAGVVTTNSLHLGCTTKPIGFTVDDASANPASDFVEVFVGNTPNVNDGVVTTSQNHKGGATDSIGYLSTKAVAGGKKLYVGTAANCNDGVVTTSANHLKCSTQFVGYALPK